MRRIWQRVAVARCAESIVLAFLVSAAASGCAGDDNTAVEDVDGAVDAMGHEGSIVSEGAAGSGGSLIVADGAGGGGAGASGGGGAGGSGGGGAGASVDGGVGDATVDQISIDGEAGAIADGGRDADSGNADVSADVTSSGDAGADGEAGPDGPTLATFANDINSVWCQRLGECCGIAPNSFDQSKCTNYWSTQEGAEALGAYLQAYSGDFSGRPLVFDKAQAQQCLDMLRTKPCDLQTGDSRRQIYVTCITAIQGGLTNGASGCKTSLECTSGLYCKPGADGGLGTCVPLIAQGTTCDDPLFNSDRCSYLGTSVSGLHCSYPGYKCEQSLDLASSCFGDNWCTSGVCSTNSGACVNSQPFGPPYCDNYLRPDAGGD